MIRREELSAQESEDGQCRVLCYYASSAERNFEWFRLELNAGGSYTSVGHRDRALEDVIVRIHPEYRLAVHIDYDEANAAHLSGGHITGRLLKNR